MTKYSKNYKRTKHPYLLRLLTIWRVITCRNFIFVDFYEYEKNGEKMRKIRPIFRNDYDSESELLTIEGLKLLTQKKHENK